MTSHISAPSTVPRSVARQGLSWGKALAILQLICSEINRAGRRAAQGTEAVLLAKEQFPGREIMYVTLYYTDTVLTVLEGFQQAGQFDPWATAQADSETEELEILSFFTTFSASMIALIRSGRLHGQMAPTLDVSLKGKVRKHTQVHLGIKAVELHPLSSHAISRHRVVRIIAAVLAPVTIALLITYLFTRNEQSSATGHVAQVGTASVVDAGQPPSDNDQERVVANKIEISSVHRPAIEVAPPSSPEEDPRRPALPTSSVSHRSPKKVTAPPPPEEAKPAAIKQADPSEAGAKPEDILALAELKYTDLDWIGAIAEYRKLIANKQLLRQAYLGLARASWQNGDVDGTLVAATSALGLGGGVPARKLLGNAYFRKGDYESALKHFERVLKDRPDDSEVPEMLDTTLKKLGLPPRT